MNKAVLVFDIERGETGYLVIKDESGGVTAWLETRVDEAGRQYTAMVVPLDVRTYPGYGDDDNGKGV